jgi:lipoprotein-anchoring transpeptidase ErfK/SrfK
LTRLTKRLAALALIALAALLPSAPAVAKGMSAYDLTEAAAVLAPNRFIWSDNVGQGPVSILISIPDQRAYVFQGETMVAASSVSTGKDGNDTPVGVFTILQKHKDHKSNKYDDAPMPYMQRLTWDGVALHAGRNPGFPASHGCVRMPTEFAKRLFEITSLGATVEVTDIAYVGEPMPMNTFRDTAFEAQDAKATKAANKAMKRKLDRKLTSRYP